MTTDLIHRTYVSRHATRYVGLLVLLVLFAACSSKSKPEADAIDSVTELGDTARILDVGPDRRSTADIRPDTTPAPTLVAKQVESEDELIPGPLAVGRIGDFLLRNDHLAVIIGHPEHSIWGPSGGGIIDAAPSFREDKFEELFPIVGLIRAVRVDTVEVVEDGSKGKAVVRVKGTDAGVPLIDAVLHTPKMGLDVTVEYRLGPDDRWVTIVTSVVNNGEETVFAFLGDGVVFGETVRRFAAGVGYDDDSMTTAGKLAFVGADTYDVTYMLAPKAPAKVSIALTQADLIPLSYSEANLDPGESKSVVRYFFVTHDRCLRAVVHDRIRQGLPVTGFKSQVDLSGEWTDYDYRQIRFTVNDENGFVGSFNPASNGQMAGAVPSGTYEITADGPGIVHHVWHEELNVGGAELALPAFEPTSPARLETAVKCVEGEKTGPCPGRLTLAPGKEADINAHPSYTFNVHSGESAEWVVPGEYTVTVSRGFEFSICREPVVLVAGESTPYECTLKQVVDTDGFISADLHVHSEYSIDSNLERHERVAALVAEGVEFFASTDHDVFTDFAGVIEEMNLTGLLRSSVGNEVSPLYGHLNALGSVPKNWDYFEVEWVYYDQQGEVEGMRQLPEVYVELKEEFQTHIVQINHPRCTQAFFDYIKYDPDLGPEAVDPAKFTVDSFDALEVWNSHDDLHDFMEETLLDWYSLLNRGINKPATGNSDSHEVTQYVGHPRNFVQTDAMDDESVYGAIKAFRNVVSGGPFVTFEIDGKGSGQTVVKGESKPDVYIKVQAPDWMSVDFVRLVCNGETVEEWAVEQTGEVVRFDEHYALALDKDAWCHVIAGDLDTHLAPVYRGRVPIALTNPVWIDVDGSGFEPPVK